MQPVSGKRLVPTFLVVFATTLLGLIAAAPPHRQTDAPASSVGSPAELVLPWEPLSSPPPELAVVARLIATTPQKERLAALTHLANDPSHSAPTRGVAAYAAGAMLAGKSRSAEALELLQSPDVGATALEPYAMDVAARELSSTAPVTALGLLESLVDRFPDYPDSASVRLRLAKLLEAAGERERAVSVLLPATDGAPEKTRGEALDELSKLLAGLGRTEEAVTALETLYYELPRHARAKAAGRRLTALRKKLPEVEPAHLYRLAFGRAELLMESRRYREAYDAFASLLKRFSAVADTSLVRLRMGTCQYRRRQITASIQNFKRVEADALVPEALYYRAEVERRKRRLESYRTLVTELETRYPSSLWTEKAWLALGRHLQSEDRDAEARAVYERLADRFPQGEHLLDARWRLAWDAFDKGEFESAGAGLREATRERPGADGLSRFLYWAGRSFQEAGRLEPADELYRQVLLGYQNSYYGRQATKRLTELGSRDESLDALRDARAGIDLSDAFRVERGARQRRVAELFAAGHPKTALEDAEHAIDGSRDEAAFRAIAAWLHTDQGSILRTIITIRDAFPFHVSATGDLLPRPIWELFYPMPYREHIDRYAAERGLDPYLVAGLIRQESTFNPRVRSRAGARGLMQIIPATGRQLARQERRKYRTRDLHNPEINIRYGTRYLKEVLGRFEGRVDYALASYNAGPHRVKRWTEMDMSIDPEVFVEEIPFSETRAYVKLVLRNEMLYRRLYGDPATTPAAPVAD